MSSGTTPPPPPPPYWQQPGPPMPPPRRRSRAWVWVLALVVLVVGGGAVGGFLLLNDDGDEKDGGAGGGAGNAAAGPYANACAVLQPATVEELIGTLPAGPHEVSEEYAESLPPGDPLSRTRSSCSVGSVEERRENLSRVVLDINISADKELLGDPTELLDGGEPLPGVDGGYIQSDERVTRVAWIHGAAALTLTLSHDRAFATDGVPEVVGVLNERVDERPTDAAEIPPAKKFGSDVVVDACSVFTHDEFEEGAGYRAAPDLVSRTYTTPSGSTYPTDFVNTTCRRTTAMKPFGEEQGADGLPYMDGSLSPLASIETHPTPGAALAAAQSRVDVSDYREKVRDLGDRAWLVGSSSLSLIVLKGNVKVELTAGLSNGNADWTPADMRKRLVPMAEKIVARM
ncbi:MULTISPECIES: hypothetical protein [unclassified Nocardioides]|uniref:hypothetical protein n=1 Tax=unclassified Nocardioides TaxID=2615069 RepID=UPI0007111BA5|nr:MULTISPECIES: hypothetical protein [unclassified Nocardioides]KRF20275.1 hypothetical protein ASH02_21355 [Nocardioides sp. Soil796]